MSKLGIITGTTPNDGTGDSLLDGAIKINSNFDEIYSYFGDGTTLNFVDSNIWQSTPVGINTLSNVGIATTNPRFYLEVGPIGASGTSLHVNGDVRVTGILTVGSSSITLDGDNNILNVGTGITIYGDTGVVSASDFFANGIQVGVVTASTIIYEGATLYNAWQKTDVGIHTLSNVGIGTTNPTSALTVSGDAIVSGIVTATTFSGSGSGLTGVLKNLVEDTSPQLGGFLDLNGKNIAGLGTIFVQGTVGGTYGLRTGDNVTGNHDALKVRWGPGRSEDFRIRTITNASPSTPGIELATSYADTNIYVRQYDGSNFTSVTRELTLLNTSGNTIINNSLGIGTTNLTSKLTVSGGVNISGVVTASAFVGDGSALTGVNAVGTGISVFDSSSLVGVATAIDFGTNLSVSAVSAGLVTVTATGGGGLSGIDVKDDDSSVGVATAINFGTGLSVSTVSAGIATITAIPTNNFYSGGIVTGNITLTSANKNQLIAVSTGSSITINLPAGSGLSAGDGFTIVDVGSSETSSGNAATFNITVTPDAADRILGGTGPLVIDENGASVKLVWMGSTYDWRIV